MSIRDSNVFDGCIVQPNHIRLDEDIPFHPPAPKDEPQITLYDGHPSLRARDPFADTPARTELEGD